MAAKSWVEIASDLRVAGRPITAILKLRYDDRDSALKENWCAVPQLNGTSNNTAWTTVLDSQIWVPTWAIVLKVELATFVDTGGHDVRININGTLSSVLGVNWTSTNDNTLSVTIDSGDRSTRQEMLIQSKADAGSDTNDITLKSLWWEQ